MDWQLQCRRCSVCVCGGGEGGEDGLSTLGQGGCLKQVRRSKEKRKELMKIPAPTCTADKVKSQWRTQERQNTISLRAAKEGLVPEDWRNACRSIQTGKGTQLEDGQRQWWLKSPKGMLDERGMKRGSHWWVVRKSQTTGTNLQLRWKWINV